MVQKGRKKKSIEFYTLKSHDKTQKVAILNQIRILQMLKHAQVVGYHNWYETKNHFWIIYEYLSGGNLSQVIVQDKGLPEKMLRVIAKMLLDGLWYMHSQGVLFVDFKPSNFVFDEYNNLKFSDFSNAKLISESQKQPESIPNYLPIETLTGQDAPDKRSDLWSLSVLLFQLATGRFPFGGSTTEEVLRSIRSSSALNVPSYSIEFNSFINSALKHNRAEPLNWDFIMEHKWTNFTASTCLASSHWSLINKTDTVSRTSHNPRRHTDANLTKSEVEGHSTVSDQTSQIRNFKSNSSVHPQTAQPSSTKQTEVLKNKGSPLSNKFGSSSVLAVEGNGKRNEGAFKDKDGRLTNPAPPEHQRFNLKKDQTVATLDKNSLSKAKPTPLPIKLTSKDSEKPRFSAKSALLCNYASSKSNGTTRTLPLGHSALKSKSPSATRQQHPSTLMNKPRNDSSDLFQHNRAVDKGQDEAKSDELSVSEGQSRTTGSMSQCDKPLHSMSPINHKQRPQADDDRSKTPERSPIGPKHSQGNSKGTSSEWLKSLQVEWAIKGKGARETLLANAVEGFEARELSPIVGNDSIQKYDLDPLHNAVESQVYDQFLEDAKSLQKYLVELQKTLAGNTTEYQKLTLLYHLCRNVGDEFITNFVAESAVLEVILRVAKGSKSSKLKTAVATLFGLVTRHATQLNSCVCKMDRLAPLTTQLEDSDVVVRQISLAAFGELLFYLATQAELNDSSESKTNREQLKLGLPILTKALMVSKDPTSSFYAVKAIENITTKAPSSASLLVTEDSLRAIKSVFQNATDPMLKVTCLRCFESFAFKKRVLAGVVGTKNTWDELAVMVGHKNTDVISPVLSLMTCLELVGDDQVREGVRGVCSRTSKSLVDLLLCKSLSVRNEVGRLLLATTSGSCEWFLSLVVESPFMSNVEKAITELGMIQDELGQDVEDGPQEELLMNKKVLKSTCENCMCLFEELLRKAVGTVRELKASVRNRGLKVSKSSLGQTGNGPAVDSTVLSDDLEQLLKTMCEMMSFDFVFDLLKEESVAVMFGLADDLTVVANSRSDKVVGLVFAVVSSLYKSEERIPKLLGMSFCSLFDALSDSLVRETAEEARVIKFKLLSDQFLLVFLANQNRIGGVRMAKGVQLFSRHLDSDLLQISQLALQTYRVLMDNGLVTPENSDLAAVATLLFDALAKHQSLALNQHFFKCTDHLLLLHDECIHVLLDRGFLTVATRCLAQFLDSNGVSEVVECLESFLKSLTDRLATQQLQFPVPIDMPQLVELIQLIVAFVKLNTGTLTVVPFKVVQHCLSLAIGLSAAKNSGVGDELALELLDLQPLHSAKERTQKQVGDTLRAISQLVDDSRPQKTSKSGRLG